MRKNRWANRREKKLESIDGMRRMISEVCSYLVKFVSIKIQNSVNFTKITNVFRRILRKVRLEFCHFGKFLFLSFLLIFNFLRRKR